MKYTNDTSKSILSMKEKQEPTTTLDKIWSWSAHDTEKMYVKELRLQLTGIKQEWRYMESQEMVYTKRMLHQPKDVLLGIKLKYETSLIRHKTSFITQPNEHKTT